MPLRRNFGIILGRAPYEKQLRWNNDAWHIEIELLRIGKSTVDRLNKMMWHAAREEIYGRSAELLLHVKQAAQGMPEIAADIATRYEGAQFLGLTAHERMKDELLLLRLLGGIKKPGEEGPFLMKV